MTDKYNDLFTLQEIVATQGETFDVKISQSASMADKNIVLSSYKLGDKSTSYSVVGKKEHIPAILLHFDGTDGSTTFTDENAYNDWTPSGGAELTTEIFKFGTAGGAFGDSGDYISTSAGTHLLIGDADFKIEFWIYFDATPSGGFFCVQDDASTEALSIGFDDAIILQMNSNGLETAAYCDWNPIAGVWYHIVVERSYSAIRMFINGVEQSVTVEGNSDIELLYNSGDFVIGAVGDNTVIDDFVFTIGFADRREDFTVPTSAYTNYPTSSYICFDETNPSTQLTGKYVSQLTVGDSCRKTMLHFDTNFVDESGLVWGGDATIDDTIVKFGSGSGYFNDTSIYNPAYFQISTTDYYGDWYMDLWINIGMTDTNFHSNVILFNEDSGAILFYIGDGIVGFGGETSLGTSNSYCSWVYSEDTWYHLLLGKASGNAVIFINGVSQSISGNTTVDVPLPYELIVVIDATENAFSEAAFEFNIDEFRFVVGDTTPTSNFTPPTTAYGDDTGVFQEIYKTNGTSLIFPNG